MPVAVVICVVLVALADGGAAPWGRVVLELGATGILFWVLFLIRRRGFASEGTWLRDGRARRKLSVRYPIWGTLVRFVRGPSRSKESLEIEILPPESSLREGIESHASAGFVLCTGYVFKRTWLGLPFLLLTFWMVLSVVPIQRDWLAMVSPSADALRDGAESLALADPSSPPPAPLSLTPYLTLRGLWLWLACLALFYTGVHVADKREAVDRLALLLLVTGVGFGMYGMAQWLSGLSGLPGEGFSSLRARASFGNPNHYAAFLEMLLLCSLGWLGSRWLSRRGARPRRGSRAGQWLEEAQAKLFLASMGVVLIGLGLAFSVSRSAIAFSLVACAAFALLSRTRRGSPVLIDRDTAPDVRALPARPRRLFWVLALALLAGVVWIGVDPIIGRFDVLSEDWAKEVSRRQIWTDSLGIVRDFRWTGTGLGSFGYVFPIYRSFGGEVFFSWAHNDYLQLLIELGAPGMLLLIWIASVVWRRARQARHELAGDAGHLTLYAGYCGALVAIALHSFTDYSLHMPANAALFSLILGVVVGSRSEGGESRATR